MKIILNVAEVQRILENHLRETDRIPQSAAVTFKLCKTEQYANLAEFDSQDLLTFKFDLDDEDL